MDEFISIINKLEPTLVKNFIKTNTFDINESVRVSKPNSKLKINARPIDIVWHNYVESLNTNLVDRAANCEIILELLINENSMYPQPFDVQLLKPDSRIRKLVEFSTQLHAKSPTDVAKDIARYPHLVYLFDQLNKSLLFKLWELAKPGTNELEKISKCLLVSPTEYFLLDQCGAEKSKNLLIKLKSLVSVRTLFNNKSKKQALCREINDLFLGVSDYMKLSAVVMYPRPISIVFDYTTKEPLVHLHKRFVVGCKGQRVNIDTTLDGVCTELFGVEFTTAVFSEFQSVLKLEIDIENLNYFTEHINNRLVCFQGRSVPFCKIKSICSLDKQLISRILFDKAPISFGIAPPPVVSTNTVDTVDIIYEDSLKYSNLKFVVGFGEHALFEVYYMLYEKQKLTWLWYIDVSALSIDQHCTAQTILKDAYKHSMKLGAPTYKYNWEIFLDMYTKSQAVLLFGGIDKLSNITLRRRIIKIVQSDLICERWVALNNHDLIDGPKSDFQIAFDSLKSVSYDTIVQGRPNIKKCGFEMIKKWLQ